MSQPEYRPYLHEHPRIGSGSWRAEVRWWDKASQSTKRLYLATRTSRQEADAVVQDFIRTGIRPPLSNRGRKFGEKVNAEKAAELLERMQRSTRKHVVCNEHPTRGSGIWRSQISYLDPITKKFRQMYVAQRASREDAVALADTFLRTGVRPEKEKPGPKVGQPQPHLERIKREAIARKTKPNREPRKPRAKKSAGAPPAPVQPSPAPTTPPVDRIALLKLAWARTA